MTQSSPTDVDLAAKRLQEFVDQVNGLAPADREPVDYFNGGGVDSLLRDVQSLLAHRIQVTADLPTNPAGEPIHRGRMVFGTADKFLGVTSAAGDAITLNGNRPLRIEMVTGFGMRVHFV